MNADNIEPNEDSNEALFLHFINEERNNDTEERFSTYSTYIINVHSDKNEDNKTRENTNNRKKDDN